MAETFGIGSVRTEGQQEFILPEPGEEQSLKKKKTAPATITPVVAPVVAPTPAYFKPPYEEEEITVQ
jgi:hypothetical protein